MKGFSVDEGMYNVCICCFCRGFLPYVGIVTIIMNEYPKFKCIVLLCLGIYVLIHRE